jgi:hypothetical protein
VNRTDREKEQLKAMIDAGDIVRNTESNRAEREVWTDGYIFKNQWQSFRARQDGSFEFTSAAHEYPKKGRYKISVEMIHIFGNDTTKVIEVSQ